MLLLFGELHLNGGECKKVDCVRLLLGVKAATLAAVEVEIDEGKVRRPIQKIRKEKSRASPKQKVTFCWGRAAYKRRGYFLLGRENETKEKKGRGDVKCAFLKKRGPLRGHRDEEEGHTLQILRGAGDG